MTVDEASLVFHVCVCSCVYIVLCNCVKTTHTCSDLLPSHLTHGPKTDKKNVPSAAPLAHHLKHLAFIRLQTCSKTQKRSHCILTR